MNFSLCTDLIVLCWLLSSEAPSSSSGIKSTTVLYTRFGLFGMNLSLSFKSWLGRERDSRVEGRKSLSRVGGRHSPNCIGLFTYIHPAEEYRAATLKKERQPQGYFQNTGYHQTGYSIR